MATLIEHLARALETLALNDWCVTFYDANDVELYHCHVGVPSEDATFAAAVAMELAVRQNVALPGLHRCVAAMVMDVDPTAAPQAEELRRKRHSNAAPVLWDPAWGPATAEGLPKPDAPVPDAPKGRRRYH
jgi:hypothetical protein